MKTLIYKNSIMYDTCTYAHPHELFGMCSSDIPQIYPDTATIEGLQHFYPTVDLSEVMFVKVKVEMIGDEI